MQVYQTNLLESRIIKEIVPFISTDNSRRAICFLNVTKTWITATNGHALARYPKTCLENVEEGNYFVAKAGPSYLLSRDETGQQFPNTGAIICMNLRQKYSETYGKISHNKNCTSCISVFMYSLACAGVCIDFNLLKTMPEGEFTAYFEEKTDDSKAVFFTKDKTPLKRALESETIFVLMPLRTNS